MATPRQLDLFADRGAAVEQAVMVETPVPDPQGFSDAELIATIPLAGQANAAGLAREAVRRRLRDAVPALEALCRRFAGFGQDRAIAEQTAAVDALTAMGARDAVTRLIQARAVRGPGRGHAFQAAAALACDLPVDIVAEGLQDDEPAVRTAACARARSAPEIVALLIDLLTDLHLPVAQAAARALGRLGRREGIGILMRQLADAPSTAVVEALRIVAGEDEWVRLNQAAMREPSLALPVLEVLDDSVSPRAAVIATGLRRRLGLSG